MIISPSRTRLSKEYKDLLEEKAKMTDELKRLEQIDGMSVQERKRRIAELREKLSQNPFEIPGVFGKKPKSDEKKVMYPINRPKAYTEEEIKEMRRELAVLRQPILMDGDPKVIMESKRRREQRIAELEAILEAVARSKKEKGGLGFFEKLKEFWAFVKYQRREEKLNNLNQLYKIRMKTDKPTSKEKYQKVIDLEKALENVNRDISWGTVHFLIDPRPDLRFRIDEARLAAGCALVYHSEKEWPDVLRQYEERRKRMKRAERLTKEWNKKFGFNEGWKGLEQAKDSAQRVKTTRKAGGLRESLITSSKVPNKGGRNG